MRLIIFGATGGTGGHVVQQALNVGHEVTAIVRDPARLTLGHPALRVEVVDVFDPVSLKRSMSGQDAVITAVGPRGRSDTTQVCTTAIGAILQAMAATGVRRVVALSAQPVLRSGAGEPLWFRMTIRPTIRAVYRRVYADLGRVPKSVGDGLGISACR